jgi:hypothetical protein
LAEPKSGGAGNGPKPAFLPKTAAFAEKTRFTGLSDGAKVRVMKATVSTVPRAYWPVFPKWVDIQTCIITCWAT